MSDKKPRVIKTEIVQWPVGGRSKKTYPVEFMLVESDQEPDPEALDHAAEAVARLLLERVLRRHGNG